MPLANASSLSRFLQTRVVFALALHLELNSGRALPAVECTRHFGSRVHRVALPCYATAL